MKKIMIVDDNPDVRLTLKTILNAEGYDTFLAVDGDDCLRQLKNLQEKPDLILMDVMMPGTPVAEVIEKIKDSKIAYLTAVGVTEQDKKRMLSDKKIVDFIEKPFRTDELIKVIKKHVG